MLNLSPQFATVQAALLRANHIKGGRSMPIITVDLALMESREKKDELVKALTETASSVTNIPADKFIVLINELGRDNIGVGGKLLSDLLK